MNELLAMFLDGDVHDKLQWEIAVFAVCGTAALAAIGWIVIDAISGMRGNRKKLRKTAIRLRQHDETIVEKLRDGRPYQVLEEEE